MANPSNDLQRELSGAQAALSAFASGPARQAADALSDCFGGAATKIASDLERAAKSGEVSFKRLAKTALEELARIALDDVLKKTDTSDKRGGAFQTAASALTVNFHLGAGADSESIRRNQAQIAAQVARAAAYGRRNL
jgi:hypothetical protein